MIDFEDKAASGFLRYAAFSKSFTKCYIFSLFNVMTIYYSLALVQLPIFKMKGSDSKTHIFPFPGWYPEEWTESPFYEIVLSQILAISCGGCIVFAIDALISTAIFYTCGHFKILQKNLHSFGDNMNQIVDPTDDSPSKESLKIMARQKLRTYIEHHQVILIFSETAEGLFNPIMLSQVLANMISIGLVALHITQTLRDGGKAFKYLAYFFKAFFQLLLFCLPCDRLINQCLAVSDAAYATSWYKVSNLLEADVRFIILRSQKPAKITAGKFAVMGLEYLGTVLSTSMSYFTVLQSLS